MPATIAPPKKRTRRSPEQLIADLQAEIQRVKARAERQKQKKDPTIRHVAAAVRSIDKASKATSDAPTRQALAEARATLSACLSLAGVTPKAGKAAPRATRVVRDADVESDAVLRYVAAHPGARCEDVASALEADTKAVGAALRGLKAEGQLRTEGMARGTRYFAER